MDWIAFKLIKIYFKACLFVVADGIVCQITLNKNRCCWFTVSFLVFIEVNFLLLLQLGHGVILLIVKVGKWFILWL